MQAVRYLPILLLACSSQKPLSVPSTDILTRGQAVCSGVRIAPTVLATAKHCTKHGWGLTVDGEAVWPVSEQRNDIVYLSAPEGQAYPTAAYSGEDILRISTWRGEKEAKVWHAGPTWLELDLECIPGESGSPVSSPRGVVALVTRGALNRSTCYAEYLTPDQVSQIGQPAK